MKISTKGRYALRIMLDLAVMGGEEPVWVKDIAKRQDISVKYMEQIVTILYRFAKFRGLDVGDTTDLAKKFTDAARVSDYAKEALSWTVAVGIINGMPDNTIAPQNSATRAEVATIIMRYTKLVSGTEN